MKVKVTYANKRRRAHGNGVHQSSPLEMLDPDKDDITHFEMTRRMLKRSRRVAFVEQAGDNVEQAVVRERLAKRRKHSNECPTDPSMDPRGPEFQPPFQTSHLHEPSVQQPPDHEQLSPVQPSTRTLSRTSSSTLKENTLDSPFRSRPGSLAHVSKKRSSKSTSSIASRMPLRIKLHTHFKKKEERRLSRKGIILSLRDTTRRSLGIATIHPHPSSSPSISSMRSKVAEECFLSLPTTSSHTYEGDMLSAPDTPSFFSGKPQFQSTPPFSRVDDNPGLPFDTKDSPSFSGEPMDICDSDTYMPKPDVLSGCQTLHSFRNGIPPDEFTVGPSTVIKGFAVTAKTTEINGISRTDLHPGSGQLDVQGPLSNRDSPIRICIGEYMVPLHSSPYASRSTLTRTSTTKISALALHHPASSSAPRDQGLSPDLRSYSSAGDDGPLTPPASPTRNAVTSSLDLAQVMSKLALGAGDTETRSDEEAHQSMRPTLQARSHSLNEPTDTTSTSRTAAPPKRARASTVRASDYNRSWPTVGPTAGSVVRVPSTAFNSSAADPSGSKPGIRQPREDIVINSRSGIDALTPGTRHTNAIVSQADSDDELLLRSPWIKDLEYLGLSVPKKWREGNSDELNLVAGKVWCDAEEPASSRRYWMRRR
ncbi:hypothetical protein V8B97DRAFT_2003196 [Scleroderma yunnanense]